MTRRSAAATADAAGTAARTSTATPASTTAPSATAQAAPAIPAGATAPGSPMTRLIPRPPLPPGVPGAAERPHRADAPHAVIGAEVWHTEWARQLLERLGLRTVIADERLSCERVLDTLAAQSVAFVCEELPVSGLAAMTWAARRTEALRRNDPLLGVVFMVEDHRALDPRALGPLVRTLTPGDTDLPDFLAEVQGVRREYHWELRNRRPGTRPAGEAAAPPARWTGTVPNFNVKHPSMLLPYALLSARTRRDVYCEISPQEALLFVAGSAGRGPVAAVAEVFGTLRQDVDRLNTALGSRLRLHLDHADDYEVVQAACEAGFDSVMVDGSGRTLHQNVLFTNAATELARRYDVLVEGEIGSIDGAGLRKWNKTTLSDFTRFVENTDLDLVGAHVGQFHSFDYGFAATRRSLATVGLLDDRATGDDLHAFAEACARVEKDLNDAGLPGYSAEHRLVAALARRATTEGDGPDAGPRLDAVFREARTRVPVFQRPLLDALEKEWLEQRLAKARRKTELWDEVFATEPAREHRYAAIDHGLVQALTGVLEGTGRALVVHGGSSLSRVDLASLPAHGVARVNFGSGVYADYLEALRAQLPVDLAADLAGDLNSPTGMGTWKHVRRMSYLAEATRDWRSWTDAPPSFVETFVSRLERCYAAPLRGRTPAEAQGGRR
ncbi:class II fructose-bisphosphate aldolase [Streptomyces sp. NRRL S-646]|uniref:class II fructose-bisphosphate aldolase n=1 Tax=Streptomyces sp. NRRL S-646 TaxID=1463917 RepID=UPI0013315386|nr:class II fructose-bisphosphate aldolase [Streptomyces sp. NRRL S-646]